MAAFNTFWIKNAFSAKGNPYAVGNIYGSSSKGESVTPPIEGLLTDNLGNPITDNFGNFITDNTA